MARPPSDGVKYFPVDVDIWQNNKFRILRSQFQKNAPVLIFYFLCEIYGKKGYYMPWDKQSCYLTSDGVGCGISPQLVKEFVNGAVKCGFFDKSMLEQFEVLTSAEIQRRYIRMFNSRDRLRLIKEYFLLDLDDMDDVPPKVAEKIVFFDLLGNCKKISCTENPNKITGNDTNKKRVNKIKEKESVNAPTVSDSVEAFKAYGTFSNVMLTEEEHGSLVERFGPINADHLINRFSQKIKSKGYTFANHYATILTWFDEDQKAQKTEPGFSNFDEKKFFEIALKSTYGKNKGGRN